MHIVVTADEAILSRCSTVVHATGGLEPCGGPLPDVAVPGGSLAYSRPRTTEAHGASASSRDVPMPEGAEPGCRTEHAGIGAILMEGRGPLTDCAYSDSVVPTLLAMKASGMACAI